MLPTTPTTLVLLLLLSPSSSLTPEQRLAIDTTVENDLMSYNRIPGVGLTIVESSGGSSSVYARGYGYQNWEEGIVTSNSTKFLIASISKTFTATLLMKVLSEKFPELGSLVLDTPIRQLYPGGNFTFSDRYRSEFMTFRDLLSHRHGLETENLGSSAGAFDDMEEMVYWVHRSRMRYAKEAGPFRVFPYYSNTGYVLIGKLLGEIAGVDYRSLLQDFFTALGMSESTVIEKDVNYDGMEGMAQGYYLRDGVVLKYNMSLVNRIFLGTSAGGLVTTASDMGKYLAFHLNLGKVGEEQVIGEEGMKWLRQSAFALDGVSFKTPGNEEGVTGAYGLGTGFQLGVLEGWAYMTHSGQYTPYMSDMRIYPELGLGTFFVNNGPVNIYESEFGYPRLQEEVFRIVRGSGENKTTPRKPDGHFQPKVKKPTGLKTAGHREIDQSALPGIYGNPVEGELEILAPDNNSSLYLSYGAWARGPLTPYGSNLYLINWDTDLIQEIYFGAGENAEMFVEWIDEETLKLHVTGVQEFRKGVRLDTLPEVPWEGGSCGPGEMRISFWGNNYVG